jgi:hypothetical protein
MGEPMVFMPMSRRNTFMRKLAVAAAVAALVACASPAVAVNRYWAGGGKAPSIPNLRYVVQKGPYVRPPSGVRSINYEQAFGLNDAQARYARKHRWLALTCRGKEIHPLRVRSTTLMDPTRDAAIRWRTSEIAKETNRSPYSGTLLDTLRSYSRDEFYDGDACGVSDGEWLRASVDLVKQVASKTNHKLVVANGAGMGSGQKYYASHRAADPIIRAASAVQIEHFARARDTSLDVRFINELASRGKLAFADCDASATHCQATIKKVAHPTKAFLWI